MAETTPPENTNSPASVEGAIAHVMTRAAAWLFGRDSTVIVLVAMFVLLCFGIRWVVRDVVPDHLKTFAATIEKNESSHRSEREKDNDAWRTAFQEEVAKRERAANAAHAQHKEMLDQIERLVTGRKTSALSANPPTAAETAN